MYATVSVHLSVLAATVGSLQMRLNGVTDCKELKVWHPPLRIACH